MMVGILEIAVLDMWQTVMEEDDNVMQEFIQKDERYYFKEP